MLIKKIYKKTEKHLKALADFLNQLQKKTGGKISHLQLSDHNEYLEENKSRKAKKLKYYKNITCSYLTELKGCYDVVTKEFEAGLKVGKKWILHSNNESKPFYIIENAAVKCKAEAVISEKNYYKILAQIHQ